MRLLLVEDDEVLANGLRVGLSLHGFCVEAVTSCADAHSSLETGEFDAVILDQMLPDGSGLAVLKTIRTKDVSTPTLMLTARDRIEDRIAGLDLGADDYLGKPCDLDELAARLRAIIRRASERSGTSLRWRDFSLDPARCTVSRSGTDIVLSRREFAVFHALMRRPGWVVSKRQIEDELYGWQEDVDSNAVEVHVHHLRQKLGAAVIETVRGRGYKLAEPAV